MTEQPGARPPRERRLSERLLGSAAEPSPARPARPPSEAPPAVRRAALVVGLEAAALAAVAVWLLFLTFTSTPDSVPRAVAEVVFVGLFAALLGAAAVGLWRVAAWARGPVVAVQLFLALFGVYSTFEWNGPLVGIPLLVLAAAVLYLLMAPEARLAFSQQR
ncbi:hypothetical protein ACI79D_11130 [Geodermatophilus sp. SYSU D00708]